MCEANPFIVTIISKFIPDEIKVKTSSIGGKKKKKNKKNKKGDSTGGGADRPIVVVTNLGAELRTLYDRLAERRKESELEYQLMVEGKDMDAISFAFDATGGGDVSMDDKTSTHSMDHIVRLLPCLSSACAESVTLHVSTTMSHMCHVVEVPGLQRCVSSLVAPFSCTPVAALHSSGHARTYSLLAPFTGRYGSEADRGGVLRGGDTDCAEAAPRNRHLCQRLERGGSAAG